MSRPVARGWAEIELGDHVYIAGRIGWRGLKADEYTLVGPIFLSVPNLNHGDEVHFEQVNHISQERYDESPEIQLKVGDTLLVKDGAGIGKLGYVASLPGPATVNSSLLVVRPANRLLSAKYLFYYLKGPDFQQIALGRITGSATPHLFQKDIKKLRVLVPPLDEQRRIIGKLEELSAKIDACQGRLVRIPVLLRRFRRSVLAAACSGRLTADWRDKNPASQPVREAFSSASTDGELPGTWAWVQFGDYVDNFDGRRIPISAKERKKRRGEFPYYGASGIIDSIDGYTHDGEFVLIGEDGANLLSRSTPIAFLAGGRIWVNNHAHVLRCKNDFPNAYLCAYINSIDLAPYVTGTAQPKLTQANMNAILVPVPPLAEQLEIAHRVEALFALADEIESRFGKARMQIEKLAPSLLAKAFRGELVPTEAELAHREGRDYGDAKSLLQTLSAVKAKKTPAERRQRRYASATG